MLGCLEQNLCPTVCSQITDHLSAENVLKGEFENNAAHQRLKNPMDSKRKNLNQQKNWCTRSLKLPPKMQAMSAVVSLLSHHRSYHHYGAAEKSLICNVLDFFEKERNLGRRVCVRSAARRTARACKVCVLL